MTYINNQYIRLDIPIKEIAKIEIKIDEKNNKVIEDLEIEDYPNVIIAYGEKVKYDNIFGGVKILVTNETALKKNEFVIPEYIENIIINNIIYKNNTIVLNKVKNSIKVADIMRLNNYRTPIGLDDIALEYMKDNEIDVNYMLDDGFTLLMYACCYAFYEKIALKLLEDSEIDVNKRSTKYNFTALDIVLQHNPIYKKAIIKICKKINIDLY